MKGLKTTKLLVLITTALLVSIVKDAHAQFKNLDSPFNSKIIDFQQDQQGFIWVASQTEIARFDGYEFVYPDTVKNVTPQITGIFIDSRNVLFIATKNIGLLTYNIETQTFTNQFENINEKSILGISSHSSNPDTFWVATQPGIYQISNQDTAYHPFDTPLKSLDNFFHINEHQIIFSSLEKLVLFDTLKHQTNEVEYQTNNDSTYIWDVIQTENKGLLIATDKALIKTDESLKNWLQLKHTGIQSTVQSMAHFNNQFWFGSAISGFTYLANGLENSQAINLNLETSDLDKVSVTKIFIDRSGLLWAGFFDGDIKNINPDFAEWGSGKMGQAHLGCQALNTTINHVKENNNGDLWIISGGLVTQFDIDTTQCLSIKMPDVSSEQLNKPIPVSSFADTNGSHWVFYYQYGLVNYDSTDLSIIASYKMDTQDTVFYDLIEQINDHLFLFESSSGVVMYDTKLNQTNTLKTTDGQSFDRIVYDSAVHPKNGHTLATSRGIWRLINNELNSMPEINSQIKSKFITQVLYDQQDHLWVGTKDNGLYHFNANKQLVNHYHNNKSLPQIQQVSSLIADETGDLWVSTDSGLYLLSHNNPIKYFDSSDGLIDPVFILGAKHLSQAGLIIFGSQSGLVMFDPGLIKKLQQNTPDVFLTSIKRFNQEVFAGLNYDGLSIDKGPTYLNEITLNHQDYIMSFEFAGLFYRNPEAVNYAFRLKDFDPDWRYVTTKNRHATYTNLPSGNYEFQIKSSVSDGVWNLQSNQLNIRVLPPFWLTWWAISSYVILTLLSIYWYIQRKTKANLVIAARLRDEVAVKTKELSVQKQTVETLLSKKNELFSNVSHEFRTPLTLILGPIKELINKQVDVDDIKSLKMVNRNANRLLSLVEQLLQIARVSDFQNIITSAQKTQLQVQSLVDSFQHMAQSKNIKLALTQNDQATIKVTDQFIDAVLGNLISNAIKYTSSGGSVSVTATTVDDVLRLKVEDTGAGLNEQQTKDIFKRFKRLDSHQSIEGIGIGLSVVEEVVKINDGMIQVDSEEGVGSRFTVVVPLSNQAEVNENESIGTLVKQLQQESLDSTPVEVMTDKTSENSNLNTVLVIEDNHDMREHILSIVKPHYNCLSAENGTKGLAAAIEQVPDIIISDVMMPEMDGFKVARIIRADQRTSHIPLMLLTALNDKTSRIKGWRENVDAYMTKPFDRDELLIQLENMLTIRDILKKKAGQSIGTGQPKFSTLPKKDQAFVDQLTAVIEDHFQDPLLNRVKMASLMAVSDRQLQRKLKAMIDQNPMDMLREYRLKKAKELLRDGYQVSLIADNCGFNSISYFSQCFKAQFGLSPKKYQQQIND